MNQILFTGNSNNYKNRQNVKKNDKKNYTIILLIKEPFDSDKVTLLLGRFSVVIKEHCRRSPTYYNISYKTVYIRYISKYQKSKNRGKYKL